MMRPREAGVFAKLKSRILRPGDRIERVENGILTGMPDVNYCLRPGIEGWIELKAPMEPVRATTALFKSQHPVSIEQLNWMLAQHQAGGNAWLLIATNKRALLIPARNTVTIGLRINEMTADELERIATWHTKLPVMEQPVWHALRSQLTQLSPDIHLLASVPSGKSSRTSIS